MSKRIKVQLVRGEDDNYNELWKVVKEKKYYCRNTWGKGTWYYVCDPLGYCELDREVENDVVFIVCDENGNELFESSNGGKSFPKFETVVKEKWNEVKKSITHNTENLTANFWSMCYDGTTTMEVNKWLISFKDPDLYGDKAKDYDENWTGCWAEKEIGYETIPGSEFEYLGHKYQFTKVTHKHDYCGVEWVEFVCTDSPYVVDTEWAKDRNFIKTYMYMGNWFDDSKYGMMYDKGTAEKLVTNALETIFPLDEFGYGKLYYVYINEENTWCPCQFMTKKYWEVAKILMGNDFHRENINRICENIKELTEGIVYKKNTENRNLIMEKYPDIYYYYDSDYGL